MQHNGIILSENTCSAMQIMHYQLAEKESCMTTQSVVAYIELNENLDGNVSQDVN